MELDADRPRGVLAPVDRKYLRGEKEYSRQAEYERKQAIIERVRHAILDFEILASEEFPEELLEESMDLPDTEPTVGYEPGVIDSDDVHPNIHRGLREIAAFLVRIDLDLFQFLVLDGVEWGVDRWYPDVVVDDISIRFTDPESYAERAAKDFEEGKPLSDKDVRILLEEGKVDPDELAKYLQE